MYLFLSCICFWLVLLLFLQWFNKRDVAWNSRIVSLLHAVIVCRCCEYCWLTESTWPLSNFGGEMTSCQFIPISITAAYFVYDTFVCFYLKEDMVIVLHHFISGTVVLFSWYVSKSGPEIVLAIWTSELTNPSLNLRYWLSETGSDKGLFSLLNDVLFFTGFLFLRFGVGTYMIYELYNSQNSLLLVKLGSLLFYILNICLLYQMLCVIRDMIFKKTSPTEDKTL